LSERGKGGQGGGGEEKKGSEVSYYVTARLPPACDIENTTQ